MYRAFAFQRLVLLGTLVTPISFVGLLLQPLVISVMLAPPQGRIPAGVVSPRTSRDRIDRAYYYLKGRRTDTNLAKAMEAANSAIISDPDNGDGYVCRAYVRSALQDRQRALVDLEMALQLYRRAGNELEVRNTLSIYIPQVQASPFSSTRVF